ncbi:RNA-directed DNA polymerase, eukaryota, reverse transcriptase zinc-binding domain protein [Tanacetum coccineum]
MSWRIPPHRRGIDDLSTLIARIGDLQLALNGNDKWVWSGDASGGFKTRNLAKGIEDQLLSDYVIGMYHLWNSWIPRKVNIYTWRTSLNRLPTRSNLDLRGISLPLTNYPFCEAVNEDLDHCINNSSRVLGIWSVVKVVEPIQMNRDIYLKFVISEGGKLEGIMRVIPSSVTGYFGLSRHSLRDALGYPVLCYGMLWVILSSVMRCFGLSHPPSQDALGYPAYTEKSLRTHTDFGLSIV